MTETEQDFPLEEPDETPGLEPDEEAEAEEEAPVEEPAEEPVEAEPEAEASRDDVDVERKRKALTRASDNYVKKIGDTLGPDLDGWQMCPLCADYYPGLRLPLMPSPAATAAVRVAIGLEPGDDLPKDSYSKSCPTCDGWGFTDSGSRVAGQQKLTCYDCAGRGWMPVGNEREAGSITAGNGHAIVHEGGPPAVSSNDPPEVERLKQLGYVVVPPIPPIQTT